MLVGGDEGTGLAGVGCSGSLLQTVCRAWHTVSSRCSSRCVAVTALQLTLLGSRAWHRQQGSEAGNQTGEATEELLSAPELVPGRRAPGSIGSLLQVVGQVPLALQLCCACLAVELACAQKPP